MKYNSAIHHRRSIRLRGYDYSRTGLYFITINVQNREMLFGTVENKQMLVNAAGKMVSQEWEALPQRFGNIILHEYCVMPNHFHAILEIDDRADVTVGAGLVPAPDEAADKPRDRAATRAAPTEDTATAGDDLKSDDPKTVGDMIGAFKSITTVEYIRRVKNAGWPVFNRKLWQRGYYEHIIRNERAFQNIAGYIKDNPARWTEDKFYRE